MIADKLTHRAKVNGSRRWIYRHPFHIRGTWYMYCSLWNMVPIDPKTICKYTGLKDKNHVQVFEGDILKVVPTNKGHYPTDSVFFVNSYRTAWGFEFRWVHVSGYECSTHITQIDDCYKQLLNVEVIGNIYDNPELIEVEA